MAPNKNYLSQVNTWKENLMKKDEDEKIKLEKLNRMKESGELYNIMVSDAVFLITNKFTQDSKLGTSLRTAKNGVVTLSIYKALLISTDLHLYSGSFSLPTNPHTGKQCFYYPYQFENKEEIKKYLNDVKSQLDDNIKFEERVETDSGIFAGAIIYDVKVEIDLNN